MASRGLHHVPREQGSHDAMFPGNMTLHWQNWATVFIFEHHMTRIGPVTIASSDHDITIYNVCYDIGFIHL